MKNQNKMKAIISSIYVMALTEAREGHGEHYAFIRDMAEYAIKACYNSNTNLLILATVGQSPEDMKEQVEALLKSEKIAIADKAPWET